MSENLSEFLSEMDNHPFKNPFIGRSLFLSIRLDPDDYDEDYFSRMVELLKRYGKEIWHFRVLLSYGELEHDSRRAQAVEMMKIVWDCFKHFPNLKKFSFDSYFTFGYPRFSDRRIAVICRKFSNRPFPQLPHLTDIQLETVPSLFYHLTPIKFWQQLQNLDITYQQYDNILDVSDGNLRSWLPNLKTLQLTISEPCREGSGWLDLSSLELLRCPLETLVINCYDPLCNLNGIPCVLHHFEKTLRHVSINAEVDVPGVCPMLPEYLQFCLILSPQRLKIVEIKNPTVSLNFLVCLESLEYLSIKQDTSSSSLYIVEEDAIVKINGYVDRMYESDVWRKLLSLRVIKFQGAQQGYYYTREGYLDFLGKVKDPPPE